MRALAVAAIIALFARPFLKPAGAATAGQAAKRVVIILDSSFSMRAAPTGVPLFARAQAEAANVLRNLEADCEAAVILAGATPQALLPALSRNLPALHRQLTEAQCRYELGRPAAALALAQRMLNGPGTIYVFSDFQDSNWSMVDHLPDGALCRLRPVVAAPVDNLAVTGVGFVPPEPVAGEAAEAHCRVLNCTGRARQESVRLQLGDLAQEQQVTLQPYATAEAVFNLAFSTPGIVTGKVSIPGDDLPEDNTRFVAARVRDALHVLLVTEADTNDPASAAFFVSRALVPSAQSVPGLVLTRRRGMDTDRGILETADAFALVAPAVISGEAEEIIARRVENGAQLFVFLDGPIAASLASPAFSPPFAVAEEVSSEQGAKIIPGPRRLFADADAVDWSGMRLSHYYRNTVQPDRAADVALAYSDGSAALTVSAKGQGAVVFVNMPLTVEGGDLVGHPIFPALLHELLRSSRSGNQKHAVTPGTAWTLDVPTPQEGPLTAVDPAGQPVEVKILSSGRITQLAMPPASAPGIFLVRQNGALAAAGVVNVDARESDTRTIALEKIKPGSGSAVTVIRGEEDLTLGENNRPLWPRCAGAAAGLAGLEMLLLAVWRGPEAKQ